MVKIIMVEVIKLTRANWLDAVNKTVSAILAKKIILYPTETVYGIGGDATSEEVVAKIYQIKKREQAKPLSVAFADFSAIGEYCNLSEQQEEILKRCLPGPYTFIMKIKKQIAATPSAKLGVRIPDNDFVRTLIQKSGKPLITTSANISGNKDAFSFEDVEKAVLAECDLAIDAGPTRYKQSSTVVDLIQNKILRQGAGKLKIF